MPETLRPLRRRRGSWLVSDNCYDSAETRELRRGLWLNSDFATAQNRLQSCRDANERAHITEACADWYINPQFLDDWVEQFPKSASAVLVRGIHGVKWSWRARGAAWTPNDYTRFQLRLVKAEADLLEAAKLAPKDPVPWAWLIVCYRGMSQPGKGEMAFSNAIERAPNLRIAYSEQLMSKMPRWYGSQQEASDFVWESLKSAPTNAGIETIVCELHVFSPRTSSEVQRTWAADHVRDAILDAQKRYFGSRSFVETMDSLRNRNWFAYALWRTGQRAAANAHLKHLGKVAQIMPWGQAHPIIEWAISSFKKCRRQCRGARDATSN